VASDFSAYRYATRPMEEAVSDTRAASRIIHSVSIFVVSSSTNHTTAIAEVTRPVRPSRPSGIAAAQRRPEDSLEALHRSGSDSR
jgi:hypothetical protein